jgi:hypothetical protein
MSASHHVAMASGLRAGVSRHPTSTRGLIAGPWTPLASLCCRGLCCVLSAVSVVHVLCDRTGLRASRSIGRAQRALWPCFVPHSQGACADE